MLLCQYRKKPIEEVAAMEMNFNDLEKVTGGVSTSGKDVVCYYLRYHSNQRKL